MESKQMCVSHKCDKCEKDLYEYTKSDRLLIFIIMLSVMFIVLGGITLLENSTTKYCYERHYVSGRGTDLEVIKNVDVDCPK